MNQTNVEKSQRPQEKSQSNAIKNNEGNKLQYYFEKQEQIKVKAL